MNEMKSLENQLQSWTPRRPSRDVRAKLFPEVEEAIPWNRALLWLIPAAACLMAAFITLRFSNHSRFLPVGTNAAPVFAMIGSNAVSLASEQHFLASNSGPTMEWNVWNTAAAQFTNDQSSPLRALTNHLQ